MRRIVLWAALILAVAGVWRGILAAAMPCMSRDAVLYCWYARDLGNEGLGLLKAGEYQQHPLFPLTILGVQRTLRALGAADSPATWQASGQAVVWLAGMLLVLAAALLTMRIVCVMELPVCPGRSALLALALAAVLPLNTWLSADVMSDQLHALLYLLAVALLLSLGSWRVALVCGLVSGLAYLTRPEGVVVCVAGVAVLLAQVRTLRWRTVAVRTLALLVGFAACATPYIAATGQLSPKVDKETLGDFQAAVGFPPAPSTDAGETAQAALNRLDLPWYGLVPFVLYTTFRAGRIVVPLLALPPLLHLRRRLARPPLLGLSICLAAHLSLATFLLGHHGYLQPRHTLVAVLLLLPFAAIFLAHLLSDLSASGRRTLGSVIIGLCLLPLMLYSLRIPNAADRFIPAAVAWLRQHDPQIDGKLLVGGASQRRIAFYVGLRMQPWPENEPTLERRFAELRRHIVGSRPDYFAIETGPGDECQGNDELLVQLQADDEITGHLVETHVHHARGDTALHVWEFAW
ncbi:MAG: hypothetical protein KKB50_10900 [Planctomycetes bacterium]|nr:hypothetical protein [Planctomycetota bacterium]